jgi:hypothetical protein
MAKANGIYERKGKSGDVTYYIRYQVDGTDIKERVGRKSRGFTREMAKDALKSRLGDLAQGHFNLEKVRKPVPFSKLAERYKKSLRPATSAAGRKRNKLPQSLQNCSPIRRWLISSLGRLTSGKPSRGRHSVSPPSTGA